MESFGKLSCISLLFVAEEIFDLCCRNESFDDENDLIELIVDRDMLVNDELICFYTIKILNKNIFQKQKNKIFFVFFNIHNFVLFFFISKTKQNKQNKNKHKITKQTIGNYLVTHIR